MNLALASSRVSFLKGKTFLVDAIIKSAVGLGLSVLNATPTGKLVSKGWRHSSVTNATVCRAFGIKNDTHFEYNDAIGEHSLWVIGEVGMLPQRHGDIIYRHWVRLQKLPVIIFEGDFHQLPPGTGQEADIRQCLFWRDIMTWTLTENFRCADENLLSFLRHIRTDVPSELQIRNFDDLVCGQDVEVATLSAAWEHLPGATVLTATRDTCAAVNAIGASLCDGAPLGSIPVWRSSDTAFYVDRIQLKKNMRLEITYNLDIERNLYNGASCVLKGRHARGLEVELHTGEHVLIYRRAIWQRNRERFLASAFDLSLGYATTVHKAEGLTLDSVIIVWENWSPPGWAYTALSRVKTRSSLRFLGRPTVSHFRPRV